MRPSARRRGTVPQIASGQDAAFAVVTLMGAGANTLARTWEAALAASGATLPSPEMFSEQALAAIYQDPAFVPSLTLDEIGPHLSAADTPALRVPQTQVAPPTATPVKTPRRRARRPQA